MRFLSIKDFTEGNDVIDALSDIGVEFLSYSYRTGQTDKGYFGLWTFDNVHSNTEVILHVKHFFF